MEEPSPVARACWPDVIRFQRGVFCWLTEDSRSADGTLDESLLVVALIRSFLQRRSPGNFAFDCHVLFEPSSSSHLRLES